MFYFFIDAIWCHLVKYYKFYSAFYRLRTSSHHNFSTPHVFLLTHLHTFLMRFLCIFNTCVFLFFLLLKSVIVIGTMCSLMHSRWRKCSRLYFVGSTGTDQLSFTGACWVIGTQKMHSKNTYMVLLHICNWAVWKLPQSIRDCAQLHNECLLVLCCAPTS